MSCVEVLDPLGDPWDVRSWVRSAVTWYDKRAET